MPVTVAYDAGSVAPSVLITKTRESGPRWRRLRSGRRSFRLIVDVTEASPQAPDSPEVTSGSGDSGCARVRMASKLSSSVMAKHASNPLYRTGQAARETVPQLRPAMAV